MARWQSGDAADCKSVYVGSIPTRASNFLKIQVVDSLSKARGFRGARFFVFPASLFLSPLNDGRFKYGQVAPPSPTLPSPTA